MFWKKRSRFDDLAPIGWMALGAISAFSLVSIVNAIPEEKIDSNMKKIASVSNKVSKNVKKNWENIMADTEIIDELDDDLTELTKKTKTKTKNIVGFTKK